MLWRAPLLAALVATAAPAHAAIAQDPYRPIRFTTADTAGIHHWQGFFEGLTPDSLYIRFRDADSNSAFSRSAIGGLVVTVVRRNGWERWALPDSLPLRR